MTFAKRYVGPAVLCLALATGCASSDDTPPPPPAPGTGGSAGSGGVGLQGGGGSDGGTGGAMTMAGPTRSELVSGGKRISGSTYTMDVQLGNAIDQRPIGGGGKTLEGAAAVKR